MLGERLIEGLGLGQGTRKAVEDGARPTRSAQGRPVRGAQGRPAPAQAFHHHRDGDLVGHELSLVHVGFGEETEFRALLKVFTKEVPAGNVRDAQVFGKGDGLRAFACAGGAEQNDVKGFRVHII